MPDDQMPARPAVRDAAAPNRPAEGPEQDETVGAGMGKVDELRAEGFDVANPAEAYYERTTLADAIQSARERIEEWDYGRDPHGYCHDRPDWIELVRAASVELDGLRRKVDAVRALCDEAEEGEPSAVFSQGGPVWSIYTEDIRAALDGGEA